MKEDATQPLAVSRRRVLQTGAVLSGATFLGIRATDSATAAKGKPDFSPRVWGDGKQWGTKVTGEIKNPNENSLDKFFIITIKDGVTGDPQLPDGTLPVSDAAPTNPDYNGGRWWTHVAAWTQAGVDAHGSLLPLLKRYGPAQSDSILYHYNQGHIEITEGSPGGSGAPPDYFRCPLLPVKEE